MKKKTEEIQEKLRCPFNSKLECQDCRLYQAYPGSRGDKICVFLRMND